MPQLAVTFRRRSLSARTVTEIGRSQVDAEARCVRTGQGGRREPGGWCPVRRWPRTRRRARSAAIFSSLMLALMLPCHRSQATEGPLPRHGALSRACRAAGAVGRKRYPTNHHQSRRLPAGRYLAAANAVACEVGSARAGDREGRGDDHGPMTAQGDRLLAAIDLLARHRFTTGKPAYRMA